MADRFDNEILRQQRKSREEYLELKKMQSGEIPVSTEKSESVVELKTFGDKVKNFWFYHRWATILTLSVTLVFVILIVQCAKRPDYDLIITVYTSSPISDSNCDLMTKYFENLCNDLNDDSSIKLYVNNCSYKEGSDSQLSLAATTKLQALIVSEPKAILFIIDDNTFKKMNNISYSTDFFENAPILLPDEFYNYCDNNSLYKLPENLMISNRVLKDTNLEKNETAVMCHETALKILSKLNTK